MGYVGTLGLLVSRGVGLERGDAPPKTPVDLLLVLRHASIMLDMAGGDGIAPVDRVRATGQG